MKCIILDSQAAFLEIKDLLINSKESLIDLKAEVMNFKQENDFLKKELTTLKSEIISLQLENVNIQEENYSLTEESNALKKRIKQLQQPKPNKSDKHSPKSVLQPKKQLHMNAGLYFDKNGDGPMCNICYQNRGKIVECLVDRTKPRFWGSDSFFKCPECNTLYEKDLRL